jgi:large subunit ribosomal protein L4e
LDSKSVKVIGVDGKDIGDVQLPEVFNSPVRLDVISRAVIAQQSRSFQPQGRNHMAGKRTTAESFGVGRAMSRVPRISEPPLSGQGAFAPGTVGGRLAFPPTPLKKLIKQINRKERRLALKSAIAFTASKEAVKERGHRFDDDLEFPLVVSDELEKYSRASEARALMMTLGVWDDIERVQDTVKIRNHKKKHRIGPLVVVSDSRMAGKAFGNLAGVDVVAVKDLSVEALAPGTRPGRLTIWTESAVKELTSREW